MFSFSDLKTAIANIGNEAAQLRAKLEKARQERADVDALPPSPEDVLRTLEKWIDSAAAGGLEAIKFVTEQAVRDTSIERADKGDLVLTAFKGGSMPTPRAANILALLREPIKDGLKQAVEQMDLPKGIAESERKRKLDALDREISKLEGELAEIKEQADKAGVVLRSEPRFGKEKAA